MLTKNCFFLGKHICTLVKGLRAYASYIIETFHMSMPQLFNTQSSQGKEYRQKYLIHICVKVDIV